MRDVAIALLALAGCIDEFHGSNVQVDFGPTMPVQASPYATVMTTGELPADAHFTLYAFDIDIGTAMQRQRNVVALASDAGPKAITSASTGGDPAIAVDCTDTSGIPPEVCTVDAVERCSLHSKRSRSFTTSRSIYGTALRRSS